MSLRTLQIIHLPSNLDASQLFSTTHVLWTPHVLSRTSDKFRPSHVFWTPSMFPAPRLFSIQDRVGTPGVLCAPDADWSSRGGEHVASTNGRCPHIHGDHASRGGAPQLLQVLHGQYGGVQSFFWRPWGVQSSGENTIGVQFQDFTSEESSFSPGVPWRFKCPCAAEYRVYWTCIWNNKTNIRELLRRMLPHGFTCIYWVEQFGRWLQFALQDGKDK